MTTDLPKERTPMPMIAAVLTALLACLLPLAAPAQSRAQTGSDQILYPLVDLGDNLWTTQQLRRFQGPDRYQKLFEEKVLQEMYRRNPTLPASTAILEIQKLREVIRKDRTSETDKFRAEPLTFGDTAQSILGLLGKTPDASGDLKLVTAVVIEVTKGAMYLKGHAGADSPLDDTQYLTQVDMANQMSQTHRQATDTFQASRDLARGPQGGFFANAYDTLYGPQANCSIRCNGDQLVESSAELRDVDVVRSIVDSATGKIRDDLKTATGQIRLDVSRLQAFAQREFTAIHTELGDIRGDIAVIDANQKALNAEFKDFVGKWEKSEEYRREQEALAAAAQQEAQDRETVLQGSKSAVYLISTFVGFADKELGKDIYTVGNSLIQLADTTNQLVKFFAKGAEVFANPMNYFNLVSMGASIVSAVLPLIDVFGEQVEQPSPDQMILDEIRATREQINGLRIEMHERFDRIDQGLNQLFSTLAENFGKLNFATRKIDGDLNTIKTGLADLQISVDDFERNMHQMTSDLGRRDLWHAIDEGLNWSLIQNDLPMQARDYLHFNSFFYTWATADALDSVAVGPEGRSTDDEQLLAELTKYPLETNVNYFDQVLEERLGVGLFESPRLVNARDWALGARAFTRLALDWPQHAAAGDPARFERIADKGRELQSDLGRISRSPSLFEALFGNYAAKKAAVEQQLTADENAFLAERGVPRELVWGGVDQVPTGHELPLPNVKYCGADGPLSLPANMTVKDMVPPQYSFAQGLKAGEVEVCWGAGFVDMRSTGSNAAHTLTQHGKLQFSITTRYKRAGETNWNTARARVYTSPQEELVGHWVSEETIPGKPPRWFFETVDPADAAMSRWEGGLKAAFETAAVASDHPELHAEVRSEVVELQRQLQTQHYRRVNEQFGQAGELRTRAIRLGGATALLRGLIQLGFPRALGGDQLMASLLDGSAAIYDGDSMRRAYQSAIASPSGRNVLQEFTGNGKERADVLADRVSDYLDKVAAGGYVEYQPLLRLTTNQVDTARALTFRAPVGQPCEATGTCPPPPPSCEATGTCPPPPSCEATGTCPPPPSCEATGTCPPPSCQATGTCPPPACEVTKTCPPPPCHATGTCLDTERPTASLSVRSQSLGAVRSKGLSVAVKASEAGTARVELLLDGRTARKLGLSAAKPVVVGRGSAKLGSAGTVKVVVKLTSKARAKLARVRKARFTVRAVFTDRAGNAGAATTKQIVLKR